MNHPFEVGNWYENRAGEYKVVEIDGATMTIRYEDGDTIQTPIRLQRRILNNIQMEKEIRKQREQRKREKARKKRLSRRYGRDFDGLDEDDFQESVIGTSWRARSGLGGRLAQELAKASDRQFVSYAVPRQPQVHVVHPDAYDRKNSEVRGKFQFVLDENGVYHGFSIEKGNGNVDDKWDWPHFVSALGGDEDLQQTLQQVMNELDLQWQVFAHGEDETHSLMSVEANGDGLVAHNGADEPQPIDWSDFATTLEEVSEDQPCELFLMQRLEKEEALDLGEDLAQEVASVWTELVPVYMACTQR